MLWQYLCIYLGKCAASKYAQQLDTNTKRQLDFSTDSNMCTYNIYAIYRTIIPMSSPTAASLLDQKIVGQFVEKYFLVSFSVIRCHLLRTVSSEDPFSKSYPSALIVPSSD